MEWYYSNNGQQAGPVSQDQLAELFRNGTVKPFDLVWNETMTEWTAIGKVEAFASAAPATAPAPPSVGAAPTLSAAAMAGSGAYSPQFAAAPQKTDGLAITSLVLGILSMICCGMGILTGIPAVICGHIAMGRMKKDPNLQGKGLAIAGLIMGYLGIVVSVIYLIYVVAFGGMAAFEESMRQIEANQP
jgi:hypothetical protein